MPVDMARSLPFRLDEHFARVSPGFQQLIRFDPIWHFGLAGGYLAFYESTAFAAFSFPSHHRKNSF